MKYIGAVIGFATLFVGAYAIGVYNRPAVVTENRHVASYPHKDFYLGLEQPQYQQRIGEKIYGGIVSHHLLTSDDMGKFFAEFSDQSVGTVVLIGPNHFSIGQSNISISRQAYDTPWGTVFPALETIDTLLASEVANNDEEPFIYEHSMAALVPFIAHHLPQATIVPIVIQSGTTPVELDYLIKELVETLSADAIVVASVDFSHHLNRLGASFHDQASLSAIKSFDFQRVFNLEIDSPPSIYTLLKYLETQGAQKMSLLNKNSTEYTGNPSSEDVTSYFFAHFTKGVVESEDTAITLHFGDMMFDREVGNLLLSAGDPFEYIKGVEGNFLRGVDAVVANLEGPITTATDCVQKEVVFKFPPQTARLLGSYLDGVNVANNHSADCKVRGLEDTKQALSAEDVFSVGENLSPRVVAVGDLEVAIIGISELGRRPEAFTAEAALITELKSKYDHVVVHIHWGYELASEPSDQQRQIAKILVDAGADVLIGHHPHVVQPLERYKDSLIFYSLGNFIFDQNQPGTQTGIGVGLVHQKGGLGAYIFPYTINDLKPKLLNYDATKEFCDRFLKATSEIVKDTCYIEIGLKR